jgi:hypothetical protein
MMKRIVLLSFAAFYFSCSNVSRSVAIDYNNSIIYAQLRIAGAVKELKSTFERKDSAEMFTKLKDLRYVCDSVIAVLHKQKSPEGAEEFKRTALELFGFYKRVMEKDYADLLGIILKTGYTDEDEGKINVMNDKIREEEKKLDYALKVAQFNFSKRYEFEADQSGSKK